MKILVEFEAGRLNELQFSTPALVVDLNDGVSIGVVFFGVYAGVNFKKYQK